MSESTKPNRVVIVDADNPLHEVHGEFFWRDDHERLVAEARAEAFQLGFAEGSRHSVAVSSNPVIVRVRRRRPLLRMAMFVMVVLVAAAYVWSLVNA